MMASSRLAGLEILIVCAIILGPSTIVSEGAGGCDCSVLAREAMECLRDRWASLEVNLDKQENNVSGLIALLSDPPVEGLSPDLLAQCKTVVAHACLDECIEESWEEACSSWNSESRTLTNLGTLTRCYGLYVDSSPPPNVVKDLEDLSIRILSSNPDIRTRLVLLHIIEPYSFQNPDLLKQLLDEMQWSSNFRVRAESWRRFMEFTRVRHDAYDFDGAERRRNQQVTRLRYLLDRGALPVPSPEPVPRHREPFPVVSGNPEEEALSAIETGTKCIGLSRLDESTPDSDEIRVWMQPSYTTTSQLAAPYHTLLRLQQTQQGLELEVFSLLWRIQFKSDVSFRQKKWWDSCVEERACEAGRVCRVDIGINKDWIQAWEYLESLGIWSVPSASEASGFNSWKETPPSFAVETLRSGRYRVSLHQSRPSDPVFYHRRMLEILAVVETMEFAISLHNLKRDPPWKR